MTNSRNDHNRPLIEGESEAITIGCRHSNPDICSRHSIKGVCAFVSKDNYCNKPPVTWKKLYKQLLELKEEHESG